LEEKTKKKVNITKSKITKDNSKKSKKVSSKENLKVKKDKDKIKKVSKNIKQKADSKIKTTSKNSDIKASLKNMKKIAEKTVEPKKQRIYKEPNKSETETTVNVLYWKEIVSIYTNNVVLQKQLRKVLGKPTKEDMRGRSIVATRWDVPMSEKNKLSQMILKANLFEL